MSTRASEHHLMQRAIAAAAGARSRTSPNPWVGCVIETPEGDDVRRRHRTTGRSSRRDRGTASGRRTGRRGRRSSRPSSPARITDGPRHASTRSSRRVSRGSSSASKTLTRTSTGAASRSCRAAGIEVTSRRVRGRGAGTACAVPEAPSHRSAVCRAQARGHARRAHRGTRRHEPVDHRRARTARRPSVSGPRATP